ncbi:MAG: beta-N-acetylhexosaminidase [Lachnospiraceae bacterium]|nr:beta-N-acetylhexosaminidase [Lachnospiraceae bacterium]
MSYSKKDKATDIREEYMYDGEASGSMGSVEGTDEAGSRGTVERDDAASKKADRREFRRRRRRRNQLAAYAVVIIFIAVVAFGIVSGVRYITSAGADMEEEQQTMVDNLLASEETLSEPEITETTQVAELSDEEKLDEIINALIEVMPIEDKVAGLFIVTPESITGVSTAVKAGEGTKNALSNYSVGGIIYQSKNIQSEEQLTEMIDNTVLYSSYPLFIAVQEEGGDVSSVASAGIGTMTDSAADIAAAGDTSNAYQAGSTIGGYLSALGFNLDFAPVADLNNVEDSIIGERSYGSDAEAVSGYVTAMLQGLTENDVTACLVHFPGIGSSTEDTASGIAATDRSAEDFRANEFKVFEAGIDAGAEMIMVSNISAPSLTGDNTPCSMSDAVVTDILREELGFRGVIISEAMNKNAVSDYYTSDEAAVLALRAGCDMILMPEDFEAAYEGVLQAVEEGTISEERINDSLRRIYRIKYADKLE